MSFLSWSRRETRRASWMRGAAQNSECREFQVGDCPAWASDFWLVRPWGAGISPLSSPRASCHAPGQSPNRAGPGSQAHSSNPTYLTLNSHQMISRPFLDQYQRVCQRHRTGSLVSPLRTSPMGCATEMRGLFLLQMSQSWPLHLGAFGQDTSVLVLP